MNKMMYFSIIVFIVFALLFPGPLLVQVLHESLGIIFGVLVIVHLITHFDWIKRITKQLQNPKVNKELKIMYFLNFLLLLFVLAAIFSGMMISEVLFKNFRLIELKNMRDIHETFRLIVGILLIAHLFLQRKKLIMIFNKIVLKK